MTDTVRNALYFQNVFRDGLPPNSIVPQMDRDFVASVLSATVGITAAGTNQATATPLTTYVNLITTVASGTGVILTAGVRALIMHRGANPLAVYPPVSGQLEALATNAPFMLQAGQDAYFLFDPNNPNHGYVSAMINIATLATSLPATAGVLWNNGGVLSVS